MVQICNDHYSVMLQLFQTVQAKEKCFRLGCLNHFEPCAMLSPQKTFLIGFLQGLFYMMMSRIADAFRRYSVFSWVLTSRG